MADFYDKVSAAIDRCMCAIDPSFDAQLEQLDREIERIWQEHRKQVELTASELANALSEFCSWYWGGERDKFSPTAQEAITRCLWGRVSDAYVKASKRSEPAGPFSERDGGRRNSKGSRPSEDKIDAACSVKCCFE